MRYTRATHEPMDQWHGQQRPGQGPEKQNRHEVPQRLGMIERHDEALHVVQPEESAGGLGIGERQYCVPRRRDAGGHAEVPEPLP